MKKYHIDNQKLIKQYRLDNKDRVKKYVEKNKDKINKKRAKRVNEKYKNDPKYLINKYVAVIIRSFIHDKNSKRKCVAIKYTCKKFRKYIESKFTKNMNWENYGRTGWHIDHIKPYHLYNFKNLKDKELAKYWSLDNLQPLWATTKIAIENGEDSSYVGNVEKGIICPQSVD